MPREITTGDRVAGFRVGELIHDGTMSRLYRVHGARRRIPLAIKVPRLDPYGALSSFAAFETEQRILAVLAGRHAPRVVATGDLVKAPYIVMEYIAGRDLQEAAAQAPLAPERIRALMIPVCRAVHELHRHNIIHLDLKPDNILNRPGGEAVLIDFGLAHHSHIPDMIDAAFGEDEGTIPYIAPEQIHHIRTESRSDVYALGAILYRLATGAYPFGRPNLLSLRARLRRPPLPPRACNPGVPPWLQEIILRCLETDPRQRYATAKEVAYWLAHPSAVHLTPRARRQRAGGWCAHAAAWWRSLSRAFDDGEQLAPHERVASAPHVLVALDLGHSSAPLRQALRFAVRKFARSEPHSYFTFFGVIDAQGPEEEGPQRAEHAPAIERQVMMRNWVQDLRLPAGRANFQVVPGDAAAAIIDYAQRHVIDHIILGARASSAMRRYLGSVSARVVAEAPCSVTVVRSRRDTR